jgi:hypothetical protein
MEWKYKWVFLSVLLCLVVSDEIIAQDCLMFKYDKSGNRVEMLVYDCGAESKEKTNDVIAGEISENEMPLDVLVYPNPNNGIFDIKINDVENTEVGLVNFEVYNNIGVLVKKDEMINEMRIDITDNPAGMYLLRITKDDKVYSRVIVKL